MLDYGFVTSHGSDFSNRMCRLAVELLTGMVLILGLVSDADSA